MKRKLFLMSFVFLMVSVLHAQVITTPVILSADARTSCVNTTDGFMNATAGGGVPPYTFTLTDNAGTPVGSNATGRFTNLTLGSKYFLTVTDQNGATFTRSTTVHSAPGNSYSAMMSDISCHGGKDGRVSVEGLTIENGPFQFSLDGSTLQSTPVFFDVAGGSHSVRMVDQYGCDTNISVSITDPAAATLSINAPDTSIGVGVPYTLSVNFSPFSMDSIKSYNWSPGEGLSCADCANPVTTLYNPSTEYTLNVTYNNGCVVTSTAKVTTHSVFSVYVPNVFTPNNDGNNDVFIPYGTGVKDLTLKVFNRWGEKVFESTDPFIGWDGSMSGTQALPGTYCYVMDVTFLNNQKTFRRGSVTLMR